VVPHTCRATFDRRLLPGETEADALEPLRRCVRDLQAGDPRFQAEVGIAVAVQPCYTGAALQGQRFFPAWVLAEEHPFVAGALAGLRATGLDPAVTKYGFCTNGSHSAGVAGIPTVGFGPGAEDGAHVVDESIEIAQVNQAAVGYQAIAARFLMAR
jgi:acetylornithine deacetylase/succinyl-diaminopimelate desuccinylase-like protein